MQLAIAHFGLVVLSLVDFLCAYTPFARCGDVRDANSSIVQRVLGRFGVFRGLSHHVGWELGFWEATVSAFLLSFFSCCVNLLFAVEHFRAFSVWALHSSWGSKKLKASCSPIEADLVYTSRVHGLSGPGSARSLDNAYQKCVCVQGNGLRFSIVVSRPYHLNFSGNFKRKVSDSFRRWFDANKSRAGGNPNTIPRWFPRLFHTFALLLKPDKAARSQRSAQIIISGLSPFFANEFSVRVDVLLSLIDRTNTLLAAGLSVGSLVALLPLPKKSKLQELTMTTIERHYHPLGRDVAAKENNQMCGKSEKKKENNKKNKGHSKHQNRGRDIKEDKAEELMVSEDVACEGQTAASLRELDAKFFETTILQVIPPWLFLFFLVFFYQLLFFRVPLNAQTRCVG